MNRILTSVTSRIEEKVLGDDDIAAWRDTSGVVVTDIDRRASETAVITAWLRLPGWWVGMASMIEAIATGSGSRQTSIAFGRRCRLVKLWPGLVSSVERPAK